MRTSSLIPLRFGVLLALGCLSLRAQGNYEILFPALDFNLGPEWELNFGVGVTHSTDHLIVKMILGRRFSFLPHGLARSGSIKNAARHYGYTGQEDCSDFKEPGGSEDPRQAKTPTPRC